MTPAEVIALAAEVGIREAARRSGESKSTVDRWTKNGPPVPKPPKPEPAPRVVRPRRTAPTTREEEEGEAPPDPQTAVPAASRARGAGPGDAGHRDTPTGTDGTPEDPRQAWRPTWRRKGEREAPAPPRLAVAPDPSEVPQDDRLTAQQNVALHLLLSGYHHAEISNAMGLSEWQLLAWRREPVFREVHKAALAEVQAIALESGVAWGACALDELYRIGMDPNVAEKTRTVALAGFLNRVGYANMQRLEVSNRGQSNGLASLPADRLEAEEAAAREELRVIQGGRG